MFTFLRQGLLRFYEGTFQGRKTYQYLKELESSQWLSRAEINGQQLQSLQRLLTHAYQHSRYYRDEWDRIGLNVGGMNSLSDFARWPILTKEAIRANRTDMRISLSGQRMLSKATGGSSGVPLQFDLNMESHERRVAATFRGYGWAGAGPGTRQFYLWGVPLGVRTWRQKTKDQLVDWVNHRLTVNSFDFHRDRVTEFLRSLNRYRPDVIVAYANPLYAFALALEESKLIPFSPRSIVVGAEKLYPFQREVIERVFGAPVFETYGAREFMLIGSECDRHCGFHLTNENLVVEVLDDHGRPAPDGSEGRVVITDLTNYGMPFVRYENGDRAVAGFTDCACGRGLPLLKKVVGRQLDMIETPDGRSVPGEFFPHLLKDYPAVERFQVVQDATDRVEVRIVVRDSWDIPSRVSLETELRRTLGPVIQIDVTPVPDIPLTGAGKLRVVIRNVPKG